MEGLSRLSGRNFGGWSSAAPQLSLEEEKREWEAVAEDERKRILAEAYGTPVNGANANTSSRSRNSQERCTTILAVERSSRSEEGGEEEEVCRIANVSPEEDDEEGERIGATKSLKFLKLSPEQEKASSDPKKMIKEMDENRIAQSIRDFVQEHIPAEEREAFTMACTECPSEALSTRHLMMFWRWSEGNLEAAANRLVAYWEERQKLFGEERAFQPLTLENRSEKEWVALSSGYMRPVVVPTDKGSNRTELRTDKHGRCVIVVLGARQVVGDRYSTDDMLRVMWFTLETLLESNRELQDRGFVFLGSTEGASMAQLNRKLFLRFWGLCSTALPIAVRAFHICRPSRLFIVLRPAVMHILGRFIRMRAFIHPHKETLLQDLAEFGMEEGCIPTEFGGTAAIDDYQWWCEQQGGDAADFVRQHFLRGDDWANL